MKKLIKEFREFINKGNVFDLAVGIIIGGAFRNIVTSFVSDVFMPSISLIVGNTNIAALKVVLKKAAGDTPELALNYGLFIQSAIDFILIAFVVFLVVKAINSVKRKKEEAAPPPEPSKEETLLAEIRDILKSK